MKYSEAKPGRIFVIRLEDGEIVHEALEQFARKHSVRATAIIIIGGANNPKSKRRLIWVRVMTNF